MTREEREYEWAKAAYLKAEKRLRKAMAARLYGKPGPQEFGPPTAHDWALTELQKEREFTAFCDEHRITVYGLA